MIRRRDRGRRRRKVREGIRERRRRRKRRKNRIGREERRERRRKKELHRLDRASPEVHWAKRHEVDWAGEEVPNSVLVRFALWADCTGCKANAMSILPQKECLTRAPLRESCPLHSGSEQP